MVGIAVRAVFGIPRPADGGYCATGNDRCSHLPIRVTGTAGDLVGCDAAGTCPSDSDSVVLCDSCRRGTVFTIGSSVILKNLHPSVNQAELFRLMRDSFNLQGTIHCPTFAIIGLLGSHMPSCESNYGFATILMDSCEDAELLEFLFTINGPDELFQSFAKQRPRQRRRRISA